MAIQTLYSDTKTVGTYTRARIKVVENSIDITNNSSNITVSVQMWRTNTYSVATTGNGTLTINVGGTSYTSNITNSQAITYNSYTTIGSPVTLNISHNDNGSKTINITASSSTNNANMTFSSFGNNFTLTTVPRASSITCTSPYIGDAATIHIASASSNFTHTITYAFGSLSGTLYTKTSLTSFGWDTNSIKSQLYAQIPNAKSGSGTLTCYTYSGNTLVGTKTCNFNLYAKENECKPDVSGTIVDTNSTTIALTGDSSKIVKYLSKPKVSINATFKNSASAAASNPYLITIGDQSSNNQEYTFSNGISDYNVYAKATDTRGYSSIKSYNLSTLNRYINYVKLTFTNVSVSRIESTASTASISLNGNYFNGSFGSTNNSLTLKYRYKEEGGTYGSYVLVTPTVSGNKFSYSTTLSNIDYQKNYVFEFVVSDAAMSVSSGGKILEKGESVFRIGKDYINVNGDLKADSSKVDLFKTQQAQISFNVTNVSVGSYVLNNIACPTISGYTPIGVLVEEMDYGDTNFVFAPNIRIGRIYAKLLLGYKGTATNINVYLRILYVKN